MGANSYLRLNEALDTPRAKHIPKHLLFLRDFTKNPCCKGGLQIACYEFSNSLFYWKCEKKKKNLAALPKALGNGGRKKVQFGERSCF